jgi:hypothetical protein
MNFQDQCNSIRSIKDNGGVALATNVPCCTLVRNTDPMMRDEYIPMSLVTRVLVGHPPWKTENFFIPEQVILTSPDKQFEPSTFSWGRRYKEVGYFLENPSTPGYGNIYLEGPRWGGKPSLPSLDLVEYWVDCGIDGHLAYYRKGLALVPTNLWKTDVYEHGPESLYGYPYSVHCVLDRCTNEEGFRKDVAFLSEFVQPL